MVNCFLHHIKSIRPSSNEAKITHPYIEEEGSNAVYDEEKISIQDVIIIPIELDNFEYKKGIPFLKRRILNRIIYINISTIRLKNKWIKWDRVVIFEIDLIIVSTNPGIVIDIKNKK